MSGWLSRLRRRWFPYPGELPHEHDWMAVPGFYACRVKGCYDQRGRT